MLLWALGARPGSLNSLPAGGGVLNKEIPGKEGVVATSNNVPTIWMCVLN